METDKTEGEVIDTTNDTGEGESENESDFVKVSKEEYEKLNQTLGSLKRENKDLKKPKDTTQDTSKSNQNEPKDNSLLQKSYLRSAGIIDSEEVQLALDTAKKWGVEVDSLVDDEDWKLKLEKVRTSKANVAATTKVRGGNGNAGAKASADTYIQRGTPPTAAEVPNRKERVAIVKKMIADSKDGSKFYNE